MRWFAAGLVGVALVFGAVGQSAAVSFLPLDFLPSGTSCAGRAVSADGQVVVGWATNEAGQQRAVRWVGGAAPVAIAPATSQAYGVSTDGSAAVGTMTVLLPVVHDEAFRWTEGTGAVPLGVLPGGFRSESDGKCISDDGTVIAGSGPSTWGDQAFRWVLDDPATGAGHFDPPNGLGGLQGPPFSSSGRGISADGKVIVGADGGTAAYWSEADGWIPHALNGGSVAFDASYDGSVIVGLTPSGGFRWTTPGVMTTIPGFYAFAVSDDGNILVGSDTAEEHAMIWDAAQGTRDLQAVLAGLGTTIPPNWTLTSAYDISADGKWISGVATNAAGQQQGWVASVPEPSTVALLGIAAVGLLAWAWRRRYRAV